MFIFSIKDKFNFFTPKKCKVFWFKKVLSRKVDRSIKVP